MNVVSPRHLIAAPWAHLALLVLAATGCAGSGPSDPSAGPGMTLQVPDAGSAQTPDAAPRDAAVPLCQVCCPGDRQCDSRGVRQVCRADGRGFDDAACTEQEICQSGDCAARPVCQAGQTRCHDERTVLTCRSNGTGFTSQECAQGQACYGGQCVAGLGNGKSCQGNADCASGRCLCGAEENCPDFAKPAVCVTQCDRQECASDELCLDTTTYQQSFAYPACLKRCEGTCPEAGMECSTLPVLRGQGAGAWGKACIAQGYASIGEACQEDADCIGGTCVRDYFDARVMPGYCTRRCESGGCPLGSSCVELRTGTGEYFCSVDCKSSAQGLRCPIARDEAASFYLTCHLKAVFGEGTGTARVCAPAQ